MGDETADVVVVGAGVAGLAAACELARAGLDVLILEARDRIGGRVFTRRDPALEIPIELGAELIHGRPPETMALVKQAGLRLFEREGQGWRSRKGVLEPVEGFRPAVREVFERMPEDLDPDMSLNDFLHRYCAEPRLQDAARIAARWVERYDAADPATISVRKLAQQWRAEQAIDGDRGARLADGYDRIPDLLLKQISAARRRLRLGTVANRMSWAPGEVHVDARDASGHQERSYRASQVVITIPLGVLKAGELALEPVVPAKADAMRWLEMGPVAKVVLHFRRRFWEQIGPNGGLKDMSFLQLPEEAFSTFWAGGRGPLLTAWDGGPSAASVVGRPDTEVVDMAVTSLAHGLGVAKDSVDGEMHAAYFHNWQQDRFARGAYSYVLAGGDGAQRDLAAPVASTLFFAGEATHWEGHHATVHGAIATGSRAAREVLESRGRL